ncbi:bifunctional adenosylcobinamide kinase/adenosylcobinamide-phosphate guanylyltransferase [Lachnospiraceae bacterium 42-17]|jgi:adenosylcobinamide kinase/adenosylcobinamide-phosphate guanylyltransferase|nr:bifunctional adenosylcobinamide kinase/adenosylcobinamide-phosphate guanylyltransferase [Dorea sp.]
MVHLITGGSGSGKSAYAEEEIVRCRKHILEDSGIFSPFLYVATMIPRGREAEKKIRRHREQRMDEGFLTLEKYTQLSGLEIPSNAGILLECVSNLAANEFYERNRDFEGAFEAVVSGIQSISGKTEHLVIVTNEVFSDINGYSQETQEYRRLLGKINCALARMADKVTEVVYGIPVVYKDERKDGGTFME